MHPLIPRLQALGTLWVCLALAGCASAAGSMDYYWQSLRGHVQLMQAAEPIDRWLARPDIALALRERLQLAQRARTFAVAELGLPDNDSYRRYADLQRPAAVWNVVAAPPFALQLHRWCFPVTGCIGYRGYFNEADAQAEGARLAAQGLEVEVYGVPAYSTLGYMNWAGGDPLLNTFIQWPEGELARLIFHEISHQVAYAADDTEFNESFATAVERIGGARWLAAHASAQAREEYARFDGRRQDFRALTMAWRDKLDALYRSNASDADKRERKAALMAQLRAEYESMKAQRWGGFSGYDGWFARANNASFGVLAAYNALVPDFERLFERSGRDFERFYAEVRRLADMPKAQRRASLASTGD